MMILSRFQRNSSEPIKEVMEKLHEDLDEKLIRVTMSKYRCQRETAKRIVTEQVDRRVKAILGYGR